jgi:hypothetical protein
MRTAGFLSLFLALTFLVPAQAQDAAVAARAAANQALADAKGAAGPAAQISAATHPARASARSQAITTVSSPWPSSAR